VQAAEDALQYTDFSPIARDHHRRECHIATVVGRVTRPQITKVMTGQASGSRLKCDTAVSLKPA
jgi:hypothetical protein